VVERKWLVLADGWLKSRNAKTAHGVIRYGRDPIVAVLDPEFQNNDLSTVMPALGRSAPIVGSMQEGIDAGATSLLLGVATPGGWIPDHWRPWLVQALEAAMEIANGLHGFLADDPELVALAERYGGRLWDVRKPPSSIPLNSGLAIQAPQRIVGTVGSDCAVGKMTVSLELTEIAREHGWSPEFIATGQTGILIAGKGIAVDRVISDFVSGASEQLIVDADPSSDLLLVEGQGGLWHPAYSGVTLGLLHGSAPEVLVLVHRAGRDAIEEPPYTKLPPLDHVVKTYEDIASWVRPCKVACVALNCGGMSDAEAQEHIRAAEEMTGLPAGDVWRGDSPKLWAAVEAALAATGR
jgi:uncharacterized NAD-dependent epimerase/dehydratase family protein